MLCYAVWFYAMWCFIQDASKRHHLSCYIIIVLCYVMLCYDMLCYAMLCYVRLCYVMLCYVMLCYVMTYLNTWGCVGWKSTKYRLIWCKKAKSFNSTAVSPFKRVKTGKKSWLTKCCFDHWVFLRCVYYMWGM